MSGALQRRLARAADELDERYKLAGPARKQAFGHLFPTHFSFLWGEIALYSFIVLVLTGTYLALFFHPSTAEITYQGSDPYLRGKSMSAAYASAVDLSLDVRGGLFVRQLHHWAALMFVAAMVLHMFRNYFTGAFRKPRDATWIGGVALLLLGIFEGYIGYSMLDDLLSGEGDRILSGLILSIPVVGTWLHWAVFGGEFPGEIWIFRFYVAHVLLVPGILLALIAVHLALVWYQHHTQFPGPGKSEKNLVGHRTVPMFASHSASLGLCLTGVLGMLAGLAQINPVFNYGPFEPAEGSSGSEPDWYAGFVIGALRMFPRWDIHLGNYVIPAPFWPAVALPLLMFLLLAIYPFIEQRLSGDREPHNLLQRPRDNPQRTALGAMAITFYAILLLVGGNDVLALAFQVPVEYLVWAGRIGVLVAPPLAYLVTHRVCTGLQRSDRDLLEHGIHTGLIQLGPNSDAYLPVRQPPGGLNHAERPIPVAYQGAPVQRRPQRLGTEEREPGGE